MIVQANLYFYFKEELFFFLLVELERKNNKDHKVLIHLNNFVENMNDLFIS